MGDSRKTFWIIALVVALAGIAAAVAYFVTRYIQARGNEEYDDLFDCCDYDCIDDACDCAAEEA